MTEELPAQHVSGSTKITEVFVFLSGIRSGSSAHTTLVVTRVETRERESPPVLRVFTVYSLLLECGAGSSGNRSTKITLYKYESRAERCRGVQRTRIAALRSFRT